MVFGDGESNDVI